MTSLITARYDANGNQILDPNTNDIAMSAYPVIDTKSIGNIPLATGVISPASQTPGYYLLQSAIVNKKPALVGGQRGDWRIFNLLTGEVLFDWSGVTFHQPYAACWGAENIAALPGYTPGGAYQFIDPITTPQLGLGSYVAQEKWFDPVDKVMKYYYGGYIKVYPPGVVPPATNDQTYKHSFVLETVDHQTWKVILLTTNAVPYTSVGNNTLTQWTSEIAGMIGTTNGLWISLGDGWSGGIYRYIGGGAPICDGGSNQAAQLAAALIPGTADMQVKSFVAANEKIYAKDIATQAMLSINPKTLNVGTVSTASIPLRGTSTGTFSPVSNPNYGILGNLGAAQLMGCDGALVIGNFSQLLTSAAAIPLFPSQNPGAGAPRPIGWRSNILQVAGGVVFASNGFYGGLGGDVTQSYLMYMTGSCIKIIDSGGCFHALQVLDDKLYYSCSSQTTEGVFGYVQQSFATIKSIPLVDLGTMGVPPIAEALSYSTYNSPSNASPSGIGGFFAAIPVAGYHRGELAFFSDQVGSLTFTRIAAQRANGQGTQGVGNLSTTYTPVAVTASTQLVVDLAAYIKHNDILAISFSPTTTPATTVSAISARWSLDA